VPYIRPELRPICDRTHLACDEGQLNYLVSKAVNDYLARRKLNYKTLNAAVGVLECAKLELYRRIAAPYEDGKLAENGDVYGYNVERGE